jgi:hypothetical protein
MGNCSNGTRFPARTSSTASWRLCFMVAASQISIELVIGQAG